jgi:hypothetical protein
MNLITYLEAVLIEFIVFSNFAVENQPRKIYVNILFCTLLIIPSSVNPNALMEPNEKIVTGMPPMTSIDGRVFFIIFDQVLVTKQLIIRERKS